MTFHRMTVKPNVLYRLTVILTARKNAVLKQDYSICQLRLLNEGRS